MISRYIGRMGLLCMHPASSSFPLLRSRPSPACVERPVKSHPETFCVGVSDSGDSGRIRSSGRMNNVYLFSRLVRPFTIEPSGFHKSFSPSSDAGPKSVGVLVTATSQQKFFALITVRPRSAKRLFCLRDICTFLCILALAPIKTWVGTCLTEFSLA
jgi:hypothetical protein